MANIVNVTVDDSAQTVNVTVSDGVITSAGSSQTVIDGFVVTKGVGNVAGTIEVGDKVVGWIGQVYVAGEVNTIPIGSNVANVTPAVQGEYF